LNHILRTWTGLTLGEFGVKHNLNYKARYLVVHEVDNPEIKHCVSTSAKERVASVRKWKELFMLNQNNPSKDSILTCSYPFDVIIS
jgi:hypothetical protein